MEKVLSCWRRYLESQEVTWAWSPPDWGYGPFDIPNRIFEQKVSNCPELKRLLKGEEVEVGDITYSIPPPPIFKSASH